MATREVLLRPFPRLDTLELLACSTMFCSMKNGQIWEKQLRYVQVCAASGVSLEFRDAYRSNASSWRDDVNRNSLSDVGSKQLLHFNQRLVRHCGTSNSFNEISNA